MDIPRPVEGDVNTGTDVFRACWALTVLVGVVLAFRFSIKIWVRWALPQVTAPGRVWGFEDLLFIIAYGFDITQMALIRMSSNWGLGRHFYYLTPLERSNSMKYDFISQPFAVTAAMISRTGMTWFLLTCFSASNKRIRMAIILCMNIQIVVNTVTVLQIVLQCGPNPYRPSNRLEYFHYMWEPLPADGSVTCQDHSVQAIVGFVQGGFNTVIDFFLAAIAAIELWQFFLQTLNRNPGVSAWSQFRKINSSVRSRRIWQTITLSGPLLLSGAASIVKTYLLKTLGNRNDFTYNIVPFILWVKIENYSILLATCAPVIRLFLRTFVDQRREGRSWAGYWRSNSSGGNKTHSKSSPKNSNNNIKVHKGGVTMMSTMMNTRCTTTPTTETDVDMDMELEMALTTTPTQFRQQMHQKAFTSGPTSEQQPIANNDTCTTTNVAPGRLGTRPYAHDEEAGYPAGFESWPERYESRISRVPRVPGMVTDTGRVTVQTDIVVQVDRGRKRKAAPGGGVGAAAVAGGSSAPPTKRPLSSFDGDKRFLLEDQKMGEQDLEGQFHAR